MPFISFEPEPELDICNHPEHDPPGHIVLPPGTHKWQCPNCGEVITIFVSKTTLAGDKYEDDYGDNIPRNMVDMSYESNRRF